MYHQPFAIHFHPVGDGVLISCIQINTTDKGEVHPASSQLMYKSSTLSSKTGTF